MKFDVFQQHVIQWARVRGLLDISNAQSQMLKLYEEFGELCSASVRGRQCAFDDAVGDCTVVLVILNKILEQSDIEFAKGETKAGQRADIVAIGEHIGRLSFVVNRLHRLDAEEAREHIHNALVALSSLDPDTYETNLQLVWDTISTRTGRVVDGAFVKCGD